jgi:hypothetical protein
MQRTGTADNLEVDLIALLKMQRVELIIFEHIVIIQIIIAIAGTFAVAIDLKPVRAGQALLPRSGLRTVKNIIYNARENALVVMIERALCPDRCGPG